MPLSRREFFKLGAGAAAGAALAGFGGNAAQAQEASAALIGQDPLLHLLNRVTWGVTGADLTHARQIGFHAYLDEQLHPENHADPATDALLQRLPILSMDRSSLYRLGEQEHRLLQAMVGGMVLRAVHSRHQLLERMVDFWADHFNIYIPEQSADMILFHRDVLRVHALGNFRSLLLATAKAPAMLTYLDNALNVAADPNENYARELMELHTLGVDGGYTEADVEAVARAFTGWTIHDGTRDGFYFNMDDHDAEAKQILGHRLPAGRGVEDGLHVIDLLARHPSTAQFISRKLCVRFVSDTPPQALVDSTAAIWRQTNGEIRPVLRHLLTSNEFLQSAGQKFRRPLEFFIGAMRVTQAEFTSGEAMLDMLRSLNQVPYHWAPPNGYPDIAQAWLNTGGLLQRWNTAHDLTLASSYAGYERPAVRVDLHSGIGQPATVGDLVQAVAQRVFATRLSAQQAAPFVAYVADGGDDATPLTVGTRARKLSTLYRLMLASPLYQWR